MFKKVVALVVALVIVCTASFAAETISVRADVWMPYNGEPGSEKPGYGIEMLKAVFGPQNIEIDYQTMPWNRAVAEAREGKFDCLVGAGPRDAEGFVFPSEKMGVMATDLFVKAGSTVKFTDIEGLKSMKIGIIADYSYNKELDDYIAANKDDEQKIFVATGEDALDKMIKMVGAGRIDGFVENPLVMAQNEAKAEVVSAGQVGSQDDLFIAFSPAKETSKKYAEMLSKGIQELRASGKLKEILDKYNISDWAK